MLRPASRIPTAWRPLKVRAIQRELGGFQDWVLCGGHSVALLTGRDTRRHGDVDIGVFRSRAVSCLRVLGRERVFLCRNHRPVPWNGKDIPSNVHDIWIADWTGKHWVLQVMVFDDAGSNVIYRRDRRLRWPKSCHEVSVDGIRVLNPFVTFLFKANQAQLAAKEVHDLRKLIKAANFFRR
jgi:hypothetical protein